VDYIIRKENGKQGMEESFWVIFVNFYKSNVESLFFVNKTSKLPIE